VAFNFSGAHTGYGFQISDASTAGTTMRINANSLTAGTAMAISATALTTGTGLSITAGTALTGAGNALLVTTTSTAAPTNGIVRFNFNGIRTTGGNAFQIDDASTTLATTVKINSNSLTSGTAMAISATALQTGTGLSITTGVALTGAGNALLVTASSAAAPTNGIVRFNFNGARTTAGVGFQIDDASTTLATVMQINASAITTGIAQKISATLLTTGAALEIDAGTTTGNIYARFIDGATVQGSITNAVGAAVAYNTSSDARLKENIVDTAFGLDSVLAIKVRDYNFISDPNHTVVNGFVAQELYEIYPGAVTVGSDAVDAEGRLANPWGVDYGKLTPLLAKGIQELNTKVDASAAGLSASVLQTLATANAITINGTLTINGVTIFNGNAKFNDEVQFNSDTTGTATIPAGQTSIAVTFSKPMSKAPRVTATPQGVIDGSIGVTSKSVTGFTIQLQKAQTTDIDVDWQALISQ